MSEIATRPSLLFAASPPPPSKRGPLARFDPEDRVCHSCRRRLTVRGTVTGTGGRLNIQVIHGKPRITCGRCLSRVKTRETAATLADLREQRFRLRMELLNQKARALGYASRRSTT